MAAPLCAALLMLAALFAVGCGGSKAESEGPGRLHELALFLAASKEAG